MSKKDDPHTFPDLPVGMTEKEFNHVPLRKNLWEKVKSDPLPPLGLASTIGILSYGLYSMKKGNSQMAQYMMRGRVAAQGITVVLVMYSLGYSGYKSYQDTKPQK
jgi:hypothetical protein